ncbi:MAG TPA: sigma-70 family RNA polymerase sigma factor [Intrasporangium sp.]|nr:sigma-70 family RNA polymerase sigma factor [Intrasporangium sp.]
MLAELPRIPEWSRDPDRDAIVHDLFTDQCRELVRLAYLIAGDRDVAQEAVHEAFIAVYRNWNTLRDSSSLRTSVRAEVINQCRIARRDEVRSRGLTGRLSRGRDLLASLDGDAIANDQALRAVAVLRRLPQRQREVVVCRYHLDLTEAQTAALLELEVGAVNRHAHRALQRLQRDREMAR